MNLYADARFEAPVLIAPAHVPCSSQGMGAQISAQADLDYSRSLVEALLESSADGVLVQGMDRTISHFNQRLAEMWGIPVRLLKEGSAQAAIRLALDQLSDPEGFQARLDELGEQPMAGSTDLVSLKDGRLFERIMRPLSSNGQLLGRIWSFRDITELSLDQQRLRFLANYDQLTSLPNRLMFTQRLDRAVVHAQRFNMSLAVLAINLDRFKDINNSFGHGVGDQVLRCVAAKLTQNLRGLDTVARLGGDEFVLLLDQIGDPGQAGMVAEKLIDALDSGIEVDGIEHHVGASIGISVCPSDGVDSVTLLKNADIAMYRAKDSGKNNAKYYRAGMNARAVERRAIESGLRRALENQEFLVHYQPKVCIANGQISGMEALVRWRPPDSDMVPPTLFIPLAEETGLIVPIGEWVLKAACAFTAELRRDGHVPLRVAVNLSARQFAQDSLVGDMARILDATGLDPCALDIEITESMVMGNPELAIRTLHQLKSMGMSLSIDDFGTGHSSLSYLKRFPIDTIKIDSSFIKDIPASQDDATITRTIIAMGHNLRLKVVAEGVETAAQLDFLREHGCDEIQGYLFSKPLAGKDFSALLAHQKEARANGADQSPAAWTPTERRSPAVKTPEPP